MTELTKTDLSSGVIERVEDGFAKGAVLGGPLAPFRFTLPGTMIIGIEMFRLRVNDRLTVTRRLPKHHAFQGVFVLIMRDECGIALACEETDDELVVRSGARFGLQQLRR